VRNNLHQAEVWVTADGRTVALVDMDVSHRAIRWSESLAMATDPQPSGDAACDAFDSAFDELLRADPLEWIESTALVRELARLVADDQDRVTLHRARVILHNAAHRARVRWLPW
jgi:hypothetical protein